MNRFNRYWIIFFIITICLGVGMIGANGISKTSSISGPYLKAWNIAYTAFMELDNLTNEEKKLENYDIEFSEDVENFIINFIPRLLPEDEARQLNKMVLGLEVKYWINKDNFSVIRRVFYKA